MTETPGSENPTPQPPRRARFRLRSRKQLLLTIGLACIVFIAGAVTGAGITAMRVAPRWHRPVSPKQIPERITAHMQQQLGLSDSQADHVRKILTDSQQKFAAIRDQMQPEVRAEMQHVHDQINAVLTAAQRAKWRKIYEQMSQHWRWRGHHHWRRGTPGARGGHGAPPTHPPGPTGNPPPPGSPPPPQPTTQPGQ